MVSDRESHGEMIFKLRKRVQDAVKANLFDPANKETFELMLLQIMNETERQRLHCLRLEQEFIQKAQGARSQASAYSSMSSIIYNILNGLVIKAEEDIEEIKELDEVRKEEEEKQKTIDEVKELENIKEIEKEEEIKTKRKVSKTTKRTK